MADAGTQLHLNSTCETAVVPDLAPPAWVLDLLTGPRREIADGIERTDSSQFTLVSARVCDVASLRPRDLERRVFEAYVAIAESLSAAPARKAVRFWNHAPFITDPADAGRDIYMVFNAGRFQAMRQWCGGTERFDREVATASATGHWGADLVIHCLACKTGGTALNNPRQVAPYHYSQRFGPQPPCFARATRVSTPADLLLVGGTASVRGEDSVHLDDLQSQVRETFVNLATLVAAARGTKLTPSMKLARVLSAFTELRVYLPDLRHRNDIESAVRTSFPSLRRLELVHADLCRAELLVEIEGVADLSEPGKVHEQL